MTNERITKFENRGFKHWQKGNLDRLYINAAQLGLVCTYYNTGNIQSATFQGEEISNSHGRKLKAAKTFIDCKTGQVYSDSELLRDAAQRIADEIGIGGE